MLETIEWTPQGVVMIDQTLLPTQTVFVTCTDYLEVANAIKNAREMALLPYTKRVASVGRGPRGPRGPRGSEGVVDQVEEQNIDAVIENLETGIEFEAADEIETNEEG